MSRALTGLLTVLAAVAFPDGAAAEQASQPAAPVAGQLDAGGQHTCALVAGDVRCWGLGFSGQLGYASEAGVGDDEAPGTVGPVNLGPGRTATAASAGDFHTCALLDDGSVRCWGFGADGRLGYGNSRDIGDDETPGTVGPVDLGAGRTAAAISAGSHTCVTLDNGSARCWGPGAGGGSATAIRGTSGTTRHPARSRRSLSARVGPRPPSVRAARTRVAGWTTARCAAGARVYRGSSDTRVARMLVTTSPPAPGAPSP